MPGTTDENVPSPVEEEVERTTHDPYEGTVEGESSGESTLRDIAPKATPTESAIGAASATSQGFGGLVQVIPTPKVSEVVERSTESAVNPTETASKEIKEAVSSEPSIPAAQPTEAESSKPPSRGRV